MPTPSYGDVIAEINGYQLIQDADGDLTINCDDPYNQLELSTERKNGVYSVYVQTISIGYVSIDEATDLASRIMDAVEAASEFEAVLNNSKRY